MGSNDHLHTEPIGYVPERKMGPGYRHNPDTGDCIGLDPDYHSDATGHSAESTASEERLLAMAASNATTREFDIPLSYGPETTKTLPTGANKRKQYPIGTGVIDYFPLALAEVAHCSYTGNRQHNGDNVPLRWDRSKSTDEADALIRHFVERGTIDSDGVRHSAKVAWRALALLQKEIENNR